MFQNTDQKGNLDRLLIRYQSGNEKALRELIRRTHPKLEQMIRFSTKSEDSVDDLVQECWYAIIPQLKTLNVESSFRAWALSIARRKSVDWIRDRQRQRRKGRQARMLNLQEKLDDQADDHEARLKKVKEGIEQLPESQKIVLNLFYLDNMSLKEVSSILGISEGTVKSRLFTAREFLKQNIN
jgi:RNA polymerase sigma-70 factor (ECF subfamily)